MYNVKGKIGLSPIGVCQPRKNDQSPLWLWLEEGITMPNIKRKIGSSLFSVFQQGRMRLA
jgi:hypothetical protein